MELIPQTEFTLRGSGVCRIGVVGRAPVREVYVNANHIVFIAQTGPQVAHAAAVWSVTLFFIDILNGFYTFASKVAPGHLSLQDASQLPLR